MLYSSNRRLRAGAAMLTLAAALLAGPQAQATGGVLGPVPPTASFSSTVAGAFTDTWDFSLPVPSNVVAGVLNVSFTVLGSSSGSIAGFSAWLDGSALLGSSTTQVVAPGVSLSTQTLANYSSLSAGIHQLKVSGTGVTGGTATYTGYVQAVPVPEPETYALFAAGLGVIGFVVFRRRR